MMLESARGRRLGLFGHHLLCMVINVWSRGSMVAGWWCGRLGRADLTCKRCGY